ncbi:tetratricopeptide repeat protein [Dinoroseobacter sp. S76]|uniref:tetratricopeptide repeat protein n=1 Tax=Dinoroseobacter sp. S76 TaxID=3415124 RepID=UPI003C7AB636
MKMSLISPLLALSLCASLAGGGALAETGATLKAQKARYSAAMALRAEAPEEAAAAMIALAQAGYPRAMDRLAYFHTKGQGVPLDLDAARALYEQAVAAGYERSLISLGKLALKSGDLELAEDSLREAVAKGVDKAAPVLAWAHATDRLGERSDPARGIAELRRLAAQDSRDAQIFLLAGLLKQPDAPGAAAEVLTRLETRAAEGDAKAAEGLLRYYRLRGLGSETAGTRAALLETPGMRAKIRVEEGLYLAVEREPARFWLASEALLNSAPNPVFARALTVTSKLNKNAYIRVLQAELTALGYRTGRPSPYLNAPLIRAVNAFCRDTGITDSCRLGPLKSVTIKAVAAELAARRAPPVAG